MKRRGRRQDLLDRVRPDVARRLDEPQLRLILADDDHKVTVRLPGWDYCFDLSEKFGDYEEAPSPVEGRRTLEALKEKLVEIVRKECGRRPCP